MGNTISECSLYGVIANLSLARQTKLNHSLLKTTSQSVNPSIFFKKGEVAGFRTAIHFHLCRLVVIQGYLIQDAPIVTTTTFISFKATDRRKL